MTEKSSSLVLASTSEYRKQQLQQLRIPFTACAPSCDETPQNGESADELAQRLSLAKARSLKQGYSSHLIIGGDQTAQCKGRILGKPLSKEKALEQLLWCSASQVTFYSGLALVNSATHHEQVATIKTHVHFRTLNEQQIQRYIELDNPLYCAGSFKCEGLGISLFEKIESDDPSALIGLPLIALCNMLKEENFDVLEYAH